MSNNCLSVARDFSETPGPRYKWQGPWSGEVFRPLILKKLERHDIIIVDLDGTAGYGSSFIDEAFGGLIRECLMTREDVVRRIQIKSDEDPSYLEEAQQAIREAEPRAAAS